MFFLYSIVCLTGVDFHFTASSANTVLSIFIYVWYWWRSDIWIALLPIH